MDPEITGLCRDHSFERATDLCRRCGLEFCEDCLVTPRRTNKPYCKECAMIEGGVRAHTPRPALPARLIRKRVKAFELRAARLAGPSAPDAPVLVDPALQDWLDETPTGPEREPVPAPAADAPTAATVDKPEPATVDKPEPYVAPTLSTPDEPADGVAPPIDWNQPFG